MHFLIFNNYTPFNRRHIFNVSLDFYSIFMTQLELRFTLRTELKLLYGKPLLISHPIQMADSLIRRRTQN